MPSAIASGTTTRRCSCITRRTSAMPWISSATRRPCRDVGPLDQRLEKSLVVGLFLERRDLAEGARLLERLDEGVEILRAARLDGHADHEAAVALEPRLHLRNPDVGLQRLLELAEQLRPGERPLIDDAVRLAGGGRDRLQLLRIDLGANLGGLAPKTRRFLFRFGGVRAQRALAGGQPHQLHHVERRHSQDEHGNRRERDLHRTLVVEGTRREIRAKHYAVTTALRVRSSIPTSGASTFITSGVAEIRSVSAVVRVGSIGSTGTPRRSSRLRRADSTSPIARPRPPRKTWLNRCPD